MSLEGIRLFQDKIMELEQYRQATDTPRGHILEHPDCTAVLGEMQALVHADPSITQFYAGIMRHYRRTKPESVDHERSVIAERIDMMDDEGLFTPRQAGAVYEKLRTGSLVFDEAKAYFRIFRNEIAPEDIPRDRYAKKRKPKTVAPIASEAKATEELAIHLANVEDASGNGAAPNETEAPNKKS